jgi:hypothetical protein
VFWEGIRFIFGIGLIFYFGDWFGMNQLFPFASYWRLPGIILGCNGIFCQHKF